jgi:hypothetical protein
MTEETTYTYKRDIVVWVLVLFCILIVVFVAIAIVLCMKMRAATAEEHKGSTILYDNLNDKETTGQ